MANKHVVPAPPSAHQITVTYTDRLVEYIHKIKGEVGFQIVR